MKVMKVDAIRNGTVIDHIPAGRAQRVLAILKPRSSDLVMMGITFPAGLWGKKTLSKLKVEN